MIPLDISALIATGQAAEREGQLALARKRFAEALGKLSPADKASTASELIRWIGNTHNSDGDAEAALDCFVASLAIAELNNDDVNRAYALNSMGVMRWQAGELETADDLFRQGREIAEGSSQYRLVAMISQNQGVISNIRGDLDRALRHYRNSLDGYRAIGETKFLPLVLNNLGMIYTDLRRWEDAKKSFDESSALCDELGDLRTRVMVETNLAELHYLQGDLGSARESCDSAFELASRLEHHLGLGEVYKWYGVIYREASKYSLAEAHLKSAGEIAERYGSPLLAAEVQRELAEVYRAQERNRDALLALNYAHRVFKGLSAELDLADINRRLHDLEAIFLEVVRKWGESIESKDLYTAGHCERVADYSSMLAAAVGFDTQTIVWFRMGAFLHDVGKTAIPEDILNKEGELSEEEWHLMKQHTIRGVELLSAIDFPWDIKPMVRSHHERWDGSGYPDGLAGRAIPLSARILCVADVFDALTTTRSYRKAFSREDAIIIMTKDSGRIFDPELLSLFRNALGIPDLDSLSLPV